MLYNILLNSKCLSSYMDQNIKVQGYSFQAVLKFQAHSSRLQSLYFTHQLYTPENNWSFTVKQDLPSLLRTNELLPIMLWGWLFSLFLYEKTEAHRFKWAISLYHTPITYSVASISCYGLRTMHIKITGGFVWTAES